MKETEAVPFVAITSINPPNPRIYEFLDLGYRVVIAGDETSPNESWKSVSDEVTFLTLEDQAELSPELDALVGNRTYARKNFAYLYAMQQGATRIWETDDDTFVRRDVGDPVSYTQNGGNFTWEGEQIWNPYGFYAPGSKIWPRGLPLDQVLYEHNNLPQFQPSDPDLSPSLMQCLVSGHPDVDAIYRLVMGSGSISFPPSPNTVRLSNGSYSPGNTQATIWLRESAFKFLYVPRWVSFRYCDIFKMYVAQAAIEMTYAGFLMEQVRNPHDLLADFESEIDVYTQVHKLIEALRGLTFSEPVSAYSELARIGLCDSREVECVEAFIEAHDAFLAC